MMRRICLAVVIALILTSAAYAADETLEYGRFGKLTLYRNTPQPSQVVLFVSGDGGWNLGVIDMARSLAGLDALVVGIDINHFLRELRHSSEKCSYPAADFENLSKYVQKKLGFSHYHRPVLVGYSSGATLVYGLLAQAPPNTFRGAISLGFCPDLPLNKPFCDGQALKSKPDPANHGYDFLPTDKLENRWVAFQGTIDQVCSATDVETYVKQVNTGELVLLPKVGHGFSVQRNWLPQFRDAFTRLVREEDAQSPASGVSADISDLPLVEIPASEGVSDLFAVIISGDGGWASIDREVGATLAGKGVPVVGLNSLQYFWTPRNPDQTAQDLERLLRHYLQAWRRPQVALIGYSFGAEVLPFLVERLPEDLRQRVAAVVLLGPGKTASFEFHLSDWLGGDAEGLPIAPELAKLQETKVFCFYGEKERDSLCRELPPGNKLLKPVPLAGGHHFGGNHEQLAEQIFAEIMAGSA